MLCLHESVTMWNGRSKDFCSESISRFKLKPEKKPIWLPNFCLQNFHKILDSLTNFCGLTDLANNLYCWILFIEYCNAPNRNIRLTLFWFFKIFRSLFSRTSKWCNHDLSSIFFTSRSIVSDRLSKLSAIQVSWLNNVESTCSSALWFWPSTVVDLVHLILEGQRI